MSDLARGYAMHRSVLQLDVLGQLPDPATFKTQFPTVKYVLVTLTSLANEKTNVLRASLVYVADVTLQSRDTLRRALRYLEEIGEVQADWGKAGRTSATTFRFPGFETWLAERSDPADHEGNRLTMLRFRRANGVDHAERSSAESTQGAAISDEGIAAQTVDNSPYRAAIPAAVNRNTSLNPSRVTGLPSPTVRVGPEGQGQSDQKEEKAQPADGGRPKVLRSPDDPRVLRRIEQIKATDGPRAAAAYRRTVEEAWNRQQAGRLLAEQLGGGIGEMPG